MSKNSELYWRKMLRGLKNFKKSKKCGHNKINVPGISLNEWKLYFSKLLKEDCTEFLQRKKMIKTQTLYIYHKIRERKVKTFIRN